MPKRPSRVTSSNTSSAGPPAANDGAGHARLPPAHPLRDAGLEQLHDLTGGPGVDVRRNAFADLLPEGSPHPPAPPAVKKQTPAAGKGELLRPSQLPSRYVRLQSCRELCQKIRELARSLTHVRYWHLTDLTPLRGDVRCSKEKRTWSTRTASSDLWTRSGLPHSRFRGRRPCPFKCLLKRRSLKCPAARFGGVLKKGNTCNGESSLRGRRPLQS